jgi:uncharacterized repeat protein (TIGR03803 family)
MNHSGIALVASIRVKALVCLFILSFLAAKVCASAHSEVVRKIEDQVSPILQASDDRLYGTTRGITAADLGTIFSLTADGTDYRELYRFTGTNGDGAKPVAGLIEGGDGALYGTTREGGSVSESASAGSGIVFRILKNSSDYRVLHRFSAGSSDGTFPVAPLVQGANGILYGTTSCWGLSATGAVFAINHDGSSYRIVHRFDATTGNSGYDPQPGLFAASDGALYGTVPSGSNGVGAVFRLNPDGTYREIYRFDQAGGNLGGEIAVLFEGRDGQLYGATGYGGAHDAGTAFKLKKDGSGYAVLYNFGAAPFDGGSGPYDGDGSSAAMIQGRDGRLYGVSQHGGSGLGALFELTTDGNGFQLLFDMDARTVAYLGAVPDGTSLATTVLHSWGGDRSTLLRVYPPETPDLSVTKTGPDSLKINLAGTPNEQYQILSSTDLAHWSVLTTFTMPASGGYTKLYTSDTLQGAFYRAVWSP